MKRTVKKGIELFESKEPIKLDVKEALYVGATVRNFNAGGLNGQFEVSDHLRLGYSFEYLSMD